MTYPQLAFLLALANLVIGFAGPSWLQLAIGMVVLIVLTFDRSAYAQ